MKKHVLIVLAGLVAILLLTGGCTEQWFSLFASDPGSVRVYLVNTSASRLVAGNLGLCSLGLENQPHRFIEQPPVLAPGESYALTTRQIGGAEGDCTNASPQFMIGLCGWRFGDTVESLQLQDQKFGGQIGYQFHCGDTVILRWADGGPDCGTWASEVLSAPGNPQPSQPFQTIETGGSCGG